MFGNIYRGNYLTFLSLMVIFNVSMGAFELVKGNHSVGFLAFAIAIIFLSIMSYIIDAVRVTHKMAVVSDTGINSVSCKFSNFGSYDDMLLMADRIKRRSHSELIVLFQIENRVITGETTAVVCDVYYCREKPESRKLTELVLSDFDQPIFRSNFSGRLDSMMIIAYQTNTIQSFATKKKENPFLVLLGLMKSSYS